MFSLSLSLSKTSLHQIKELLCLDSFGIGACQFFYCLILIANIASYILLFSEDYPFRVN